MSPSSIPRALQKTAGMATRRLFPTRTTLTSSSMVTMLWVDSPPANLNIGIAFRLSGRNGSQARKWLKTTGRQRV